MKQLTLILTFCLSSMAFAQYLGQGSIISLMTDESLAGGNLMYPGMKVCGVKIQATEPLDLKLIEKGLAVTEYSKEMKPFKVGYFTDGVGYNFDYSKGSYVGNVMVSVREKNKSLKEFFVEDLGLSENAVVILSTTNCK